MQQKSGSSTRTHTFFSLCSLTERMEPKIMGSMAIMTRLLYATAMPSGVDGFFSFVIVSFFALAFTFSNMPRIALFTLPMTSSAMSTIVLTLSQLSLTLYFRCPWRFLLKILVAHDWGVAIVTRSHTTTTTTTAITANDAHVNARDGR